jgi:hypothetical protein
MAIKIYQTQIRPDTKTSNVETRSDMRISQGTATQIGNAVKQFGKAAENVYVEYETRKSKNEVQDAARKIIEGDDTFEGISMAKEKAMQMTDPDEAKAYYKKALDQALTKKPNFKHRFSNRLFDTYIKKQSLEDNIAISKYSNKNFIFKSQSSDKEKIQFLKKKIIYGETKEIKNNARSELNSMFASNEFKNLHGKNADVLKQETETDIAFYKIKRAIDVDSKAGLELAKKDKNISVENFEKLRTYAKTVNAKKKALNTTNIAKINQGLDDFVIPDVNSIKEAEKIALAINDEKQIANINLIKKKGDLLLKLKEMSMDEINSAASSAFKVANTTGANADLRFRLDYINKYKNNLQTGLNKDPITTANKVGVFQTTPLNISDFLKNPMNAEDFNNHAAERVKNAKAISEYYNSPLQFFTKSEKLAIENAIQTTTDPKTLISISSGIVKAFGPDAELAFKEISKENKFLGYLGGLTLINGANDQAVLDAAYGYSLSKTDKLKKSFSSSDPSYQKVISNFREAFPLSGQQETYDNIIDGATNIYNARMYKQGKDLSKFNKKEFIKALQSAAGRQGDFGGIINYQGRFLPIPNYVKDDQFEDVIELLKKPEIFAKATGNDVPKYLSIKEGKGKLKTSNIFKEGDPTFIAVGYGKYILSQGDHPFKKNANPEFVASSKPNVNTGISYLVVDLNKIKTEIQGIK